MQAVVQENTSVRTIASNHLGLCMARAFVVPVEGTQHGCGHFGPWDNRYMPDRPPNAENARIDSRKLRDYVLNPEHDTGRYKAAFFAQMGYAATDWQLLKRDQVRRLSPADVLTTRQLAWAA